MKQTWKRLLPLLLALCLLGSMIPAALAAEDPATEEPPIVSEDPGTDDPGTDDPGTDDPAEPPELPFTDVPADRWYYDSVKTAYETGLMKGIKEELFVPDGELTRGMFVTILARVEGVEPENYPGTMFLDVKEGSWFTPYVNWAASNGIVNGVGDWKFAPDKPITREQMAAILGRYVDLKGLPLPVTDSEFDEFGYLDSASISGWAKEAVTSMKRYGLMEGGSDGTFSPKATTTRAQAAAVFIRLGKAYENVDLTGYVKVTGFVMEYGYYTRLPGATVYVGENRCMTDENGDFCIYVQPWEEPHYISARLDGFSGDGGRMYTVTEDTDIGYIVLSPSDETLAMHFLAMVASGEAAQAVDSGSWMNYTGKYTIDTTPKDRWSDRFEAFAIGDFIYGFGQEYILAGKTYDDPDSPWYNFAIFVRNNQTGRIELEKIVTSTFLGVAADKFVYHTIDNIPGDYSGVYIYAGHPDSITLDIQRDISIAYEQYGGYYYFTTYFQNGASAPTQEYELERYVDGIEPIEFYALPDLSVLS